MLSPHRKLHRQSWPNRRKWRNQLKQAAPVLRTLHQFLLQRLLRACGCQVPLLDMQRYHKLLAGASWVAEYGNPDNADEWKFIRTFSPYHNVTKDAKYPRTFFTTSTRDDRVHPGHARKMVAKMQEQDHNVLYYENIEGGHGGAANNDQAAFMSALAYTFLWKELNR